MNGIFPVLRDAFSTARRNPLTYVGLVAVPLIVALFGLLYVNVFMDPYERMKDLPVAVVNLDAGTIVDGEPKNYGNELVDAIREDDSVLWTPESPVLVDGGLENSEYYMAVVIPADFSERVAAGQTSSPEVASITFFSNMRKNFMLSTLSSKMEMKLHETVNEKIGAQYVEALAEGLYDAEEGLSDAEDGASQLKGGASELAEGVSTLGSGADELGRGADDLAEGADGLAAGLNELDWKLSGDDGTTLQEAASAVEAGAEALKEGIVAAKEGAASIAAGTQAANLVLSEAETTARGLEDDIAELVAGWKTGAVPADAAMAAIESNMLPAAEGHALSGGIGRARAALGSDGESGDSATIVGAARAIETELAAAEVKLGDAGTTGTLIFGAHSVAGGIESVVGAVESAAEGARRLQEGSSSVAEGVSALDSGVRALGDGAQELDEGAASLQEGIADGRAALGESLKAMPTEYADYIVAPVEMEEDVFGDLDAFGYGFAPLFLTLCLWLGSLLLFFIFDPFPSRNMEYAGRFAAVFGRWPLYLVLVALNVAAAAAGAELSGVPNAASGQFVAFLVAIGLSFFCILQLFSLFDIPGKAVAIVVLIVQVVCCSGTFPSVLGQGISDVPPFLPFTYAIDGVRACMSGADPSALLSDAGILMLFALASTFASVALYPLALKMKQRRDAAAIKALAIAHADSRHAEPSEPASASVPGFMRGLKHRLRHRSH